MLNITNSKDLQKLENPTLYHGTLLSLAQNILDDKAFLIDVDRKGALGYGAYAFSNYFKGAESFARYKYNVESRNCYRKNIPFDKKANQPCILSFKLNNLSKILYWSPFIEDMYTKIINGDLPNAESLKIHPTRMYNNDTPNKSLDGYVVDCLIDYIKSKSDTKTNGIMMQRYNIQLPPSKYYIPNSSTPNSTEVCLKSNRIIDFNSMKIYNEHGVRIR